MGTRNEEKMELVAHIARNAGGDLKVTRLVETVVLLYRYAASLHSLAETDCNYGLDTAQEKRRKALMGRAELQATALGAVIEFQGDPRGAPIKLHFPADWNVPDNGWSKGWCVC